MFIILFIIRCSSFCSSSDVHHFVHHQMFIILFIIRCSSFCSSSDVHHFVHHQMFIILFIIRCSSFCSSSDVYHFVHHQMFIIRSSSSEKCTDHNTPMVHRGSSFCSLNVFFFHGLCWSPSSVKPLQGVARCSLVYVSPQCLRI